MDKRYDFKESEKRLKKFWEKNKIYKFGNKGKIYSVDTPPPTVSGDISV